MLLALWMYKSHFGENPGSWVLSQNDLNQWDFRIFKSDVSQEKMNQLNFWHRGYRFKKRNIWFVNFFSWACSKELSVNQISGFLIQLYIRSYRSNQPDFLHAAIDWGKIINDLKVFSWWWSKKCCLPIRLQNSWIIYISQVRTDELAWFLPCRFRLKKCERLFVNF